MKKRLSHLDRRGRVRMVGVGGKRVTRRRATARARVLMAPATLVLLQTGRLKKGEALAAARLAGIMAAKQTPLLIPLCHPLPLERVHVDVRPVPGASAVEILATVETTGKTGVEMEALTAAAVAALTLYDMCKGVEKGITISDLQLLKKEGGRSGTWRRGKGSR